MERKIRELQAMGMTRQQAINYINQPTVPRMNMGGSIPKYDAHGDGPIFGHYLGGQAVNGADINVDTVDSKLKPGEHVIKSEAVSAFGGPGFFDQFNDAVPTLTIGPMNAQEAMENQKQVEQSYGIPSMDRNAVPPMDPQQELMNLSNLKQAGVSEISTTDSYGQKQTVKFTDKPIPPMNQSKRPIPMNNGGNASGYYLPHERRAPPPPMPQNFNWGGDVLGALTGLFQQDEESQRELQEVANRQAAVEGARQQGQAFGNVPPMRQEVPAIQSELPVINSDESLLQGSSQAVDEAQQLQQQQLHYSQNPTVQGDDLMFAQDVPQGQDRIFNQQSGIGEAQDPRFTGQFDQDNQPLYMDDNGEITNSFGDLFGQNEQRQQELQDVANRQAAFDGARQQGMGMGVPPILENPTGGYAVPFHQQAQDNFANIPTGDFDDRIIPNPNQNALATEIDSENVVSEEAALAAENVITAREDGLSDVDLAVNDQLGDLDDGDLGDTLDTNQILQITNDEQGSQELNNELETTELGGQVKSFTNKALSALGFTGDEFKQLAARTALYTLAGVLTGGSIGGSMRWAMKQSLGTVIDQQKARALERKELAKEDRSLTKTKNAENRAYNTWIKQQDYLEKIEKDKIEANGWQVSGVPSNMIDENDNLVQVKHQKKGNQYQTIISDKDGNEIQTVAGKYTPPASWRKAVKSDYGKGSNEERHQAIIDATNKFGANVSRRLDRYNKSDAAKKNRAFLDRDLAESDIYEFMMAQGYDPENDSHVSEFNNIASYGTEDYLKAVERGENPPQLKPFLEANQTNVLVQGNAELKQLMKGATSRDVKSAFYKDVQETWDSVKNEPAYQGVGGQSGLKKTLKYYIQDWKKLSKSEKEEWAKKAKESGLKHNGFTFWATQTSQTQ